MNDHNFEKARKLLDTIVTEQPNFEHGGAFYDLGCCLEELREYGSARQAFEKAISYEPANPIYLGGLASFLYL
jgi:Flp pilus assembly protein TadD